MIYILTYDAPHRKTQDLLYRIKVKGYDNVEVLGLPWVKRKNFKPLIPHRNFNILDVNPSSLCKILNYKYYQVKLEDINLKNEIMLIGGAGILPKKLVNSMKIINSHPAYLPYVRGLDSLKWAIYGNKPIGVTTHIISEDCDAGRLIRRELVSLNPWDTFHSVALRQYEMEIDMLVDSIEDIKSSSLEELSTQESDAMRRMPHKIEKELINRFESLISNLKK